MAGPEDWGAVAAPEQDEGPAAWGAKQAPAEAAAFPSIDLNDPQIYDAVREGLSVFGIKPASDISGSASRVWQALNEGAGTEPLGFSNANVKWLIDNGMFRSKPGIESVGDVFKAFNEGIMFPAAKAADAAWRLPGSLFRGAQQLGMELGLPRDVVAMPEAFMGTPHPTGIPAETLGRAITAEAQDLGVIGERPQITDGAPEQAANAAVPSRVMAAERTGDDVLRGPAPEADPWKARFEQFVGKLNTGEDVKQLIRDSATENGDFLPARQGDIPLRQVEDLATAAGVEPGSVNPSGVGRLLQNDAQVRSAMQGMLIATENVRAAAREVKTEASEENLMKLQEAMLRRDTWVEQVVGHRAEWGRTGNVFQEFLQATKEEEGFTQFLKDQGRTKEGLRKIADAVDQLDGGKAAKFLSDANKPTFWDKAMWYWVNALISGPFTHAKYIIANGAFGAYEAGVVTPLAGAIGTVRRAAGGEGGVYAGEGAARMWGMVAGTPDALVAAVRAARSGLQTPLPGEVAQGLVPKRNKNVAFQQQPIPGWLGTVIGVPSRGASAIHSFFNFLGYRASIEAQAYRTAASEGLRPTDDAFWQRRQQMADAPTPEMMTTANEEGYRLTYITELGPAGKAISSAIEKTKIGRLVMPFTHIPFNILARGVEGVPGLNLLPAESRADLLGKNGAVKQDMAISRIVAGTAVGIWAVNQVANDRMTGFGPTDPKERAQWLATGHQPYSIRIGDYWYSFNRFGSLGTMLGIYSNLGEAMPHIKPDSEELTKALTMTVHATGRLLEDEVGMQGLAGLIDAINEPERKGTRFVSSFAASWLPYSSALRQTASAMDPEMREVKSLVDGLRYYIPSTRQGLLPKRDWLGAPISNASYGGDLAVPGVSGVIQHRLATSDPVALEMQRLDLNPTHPQDRIGGVKLTPDQFDQYQATAGPFTRTALESLVNRPGWQGLPTYFREQAFRHVIDATRKTAAAAMQAAHPELILQGVQQKVDHITGASHTSRPKKPPEVTVPQ